MSANSVAGNASFTQVFTLPNQLPSVNTADLVTQNIRSQTQKDGKSLLAFFGGTGVTAPETAANVSTNGDLVSYLIKLGLVVA